jgi:putative oxidoreductase
MLSYTEHGKFRAPTQVFNFTVAAPQSQQFGPGMSRLASVSCNVPPRKWITACAGAQWSRLRRLLICIGWRGTRTGMASFIAHPAPRGSHSLTAHAIDRIVAVCGIVPYALVALLLRLVAARDFFLAGEAGVAGPTIPLSFHGSSYSLILPAGLRDETLSLFAAKFATAPVSPAIIAYCLSYAEFVLPICLVIGFGTRVAALLLLAVTILLQVYVAPDALWTAHVYWASILLVLMTCGGGAISLDRLIRHLYQK